MKKTLLSLDIWDTLLRRDVHPDAIKIFSQQRLELLEGVTEVSAPSQLLKRRQHVESKIYNLFRLNGSDGEYEIEEILNELMAEKPQIRNQLQFEISLEQKHSYLDPEIMEFLAKYDTSPNTKILVSDFYMSRERLLQILKPKLKSLDFIDLYVSCDYRLNKKGRLFQKIQELIDKSEYDDWIHIGDSLESDIQGAIRHGIEAIHYLPKKPNEVRLQIQKTFSERLLEETTKHDNYSSDELIGIGLVGFSELINSEAHKYSSDIFCLEREGIVIAEYIASVMESSVYDIPRRKLVTLPVSRLALFSAAYHVAPEYCLKKIINSYPDITPERFLKSLSVSDFDKFENTEMPLENFLSIEMNKLNISRHCQNSYDQAVLTLQPYFDGNSNAVVVDLGWIGSMQEYLEFIFPEINFRGVYVALHNSSKLKITGKALSYLDSKHPSFEKIIQNVRPVEMLFTPIGVGSILKYENMQPVRSEKLINEVPSIFVDYRDSILTNMPHYIECTKRNLLTIFEMSRFLALGLEDFLTNPNKSTLEQYLDTSHDETFGMGYITLPNNIRYFDSVKRIILGSSKEIKEEVWHQTGWVEAAAFKLTGVVPDSPLNVVITPFLRRLRNSAHRKKFFRFIKIENASRILGTINKIGLRQTLQVIASKAKNL